MPRCARSMIACGAFLHLASAAADGETLREIAQRKGVVFGAMILDQTWQAPQQQALVAAEFGAATVGTFWNRTRPAPGVFDWSVTDDAVQWAGAQGMAIHLHPLLYPADVQNPQWVRDELDNNPAGALALLEDHMRNAMTRYKDVVDVWDVVNEAVDPSGGYRPSKWKTALESDPNVDNYVVEAFRIARRIDPDATLLYNEHDIELSSGYQTNKWNWTKQIIQALDAEGLVDGLGWQLHTTPDEVLGAQFVAAERMQWVLDLGLKNYVTELDLEIGLGADQLDRQRQAYEEVVRVWLDKSGGGWLQTWGVYDGQSWLGSDKRPLLFDDNYAPKPARQGVADALYSVPDLGDLNGDASIDATDLGLLAAAAAAGSTDRRYDLNRDGVVDFAVGAAGVTSDSDYLVRVLLDTEYGDV
ncbi:MAG: endo-1,4-beta-xylanase, partial [Planctomycetota bacterium]